MNRFGDTEAPPSNDVQVIEAVQQYLATLEAGIIPDRLKFLESHPQISQELAACLDGLEFVHGAAAGLHAPESAGMWTGEEALPGYPLGDFRIIRQIGRGGMGVVYEAEQLSLGRRVALKVLPFAAAFQPRYLQRFKHEAQAAAHLHHSNIVPVHAVGSERGVHYYAMQYIEGQGLDQVIRDRRRRSANPHTAENPASPGSAPAAPNERASLPATMSPSRSDETVPAVATVVTHTAGTFSGNCGYHRVVAQLGIQAAEALAYAHSEGVIHRDIKPANLLLDAQGRLWITDFGLALFHGDAGLTLTGDLLGTLRYMSPEQALAKPEGVDCRTDIYSLGVTLYELVTLQPAFAGHNREHLLRQIAWEEPTAPRRLDKTIPTELETILLKAMAKEPAQRYESAQELAEDLRRFLENQPIRARRPSLAQRLTMWTRRHRALVRVAAATLVVASVAMIAGLALLWHQKRQTVAALQSEAEQRQRAEQNWQLALKALNTIYLQTAERQFPRDPLREREDRELLAQALQFYEDFVSANRPHQAVRSETAEAYLRVGEIHKRLGRPRQAEDAFRRSLALLEELVAEHPANPKYRRDQATVLHRLAAIMADTARLPEAEALYRTVLDHRQPMVRAPDADPDCRFDWASTWNDMALVLHRLGRHGEAEDGWRTALSIWEQLAEEHPENIRYSAEVASARHNLASLKLSLGKLQDAEPMLRETLVLRKRLRSMSPLPVYRMKLALTHHNLGILLKSTGRQRDAELEYKHAVSLGEELVAEFPAVHAMRYDLAGYYDHLGNALTDLGRYSEADDTYAKAQALLDGLLNEAPGALKYREMLAINLINRGVLERTRNRYPEAESLLVRARDLCKQLAAEKPGIASFRQHLATAEKNLTELAERRDRRDSASPKSSHE
jgi:serine/threonine protein kinase